MKRQIGIGSWAGFLCGAVILLAAGTAEAQRHPRYPNAPVNDPQLILPTDQAASCFNPKPSGGGYDQFESFDVYAQPASKGYLCIAVPEGRTFVIDTLFAEADYDSETPAPPEWYLDTTVGHYEQLTGFAAAHAGGLTSRPHYLLNQSVRIPVTGGTTVTLIMHNFVVGQSQQIVETPGTASLSLIGHWE